MKKVLIILSLFIPCYTQAQLSERTEDKEKIQIIINNMVHAWSKGDAEMFARDFLEDADFTVWFGMQLKGKKKLFLGIISFSKISIQVPPGI